MQQNEPQIEVLIEEAVSNNRKKRLLVWTGAAAFFAVVFSVFMVNVKSDVVDFAVVGDIMAHEPQIIAAYDNNCSCFNFDPVFKIITPYLEADLTVGNLETTLPGTYRRFAGYPQFGAPDSLARALKNAGFDILSTANNHSVDKGKIGITRTLDVLDNLQIAHLGTYRSRKEHSENRVLFVEKNNLKMAFLNYTFSTNGIAIPDEVVVNMVDKKQISEDIALAKKQKPDAIIVMYHFGTEYARLPDSYQKDLVDFTFNEGADIILGGHPHVLQPYKKLTLKDKDGITKERFVIYSLGNFISNQQRRYTDGGVILKFRLQKEDGKLSINSIRHEPVWVLREKRNNRLVFEILPVHKYVHEDYFSTLSKTAQKNLAIYYGDLSAHYKDVPADIKPPVIENKRLSDLLKEAKP